MYSVQQYTSQYEHNHKLKMCCNSGFVIRLKGQNEPVKSASIICSRENVGATFLMANGQSANSSTCQIGKITLQIL